MSNTALEAIKKSIRLTITALERTDTSTFYGATDESRHNERVDTLKRFSAEYGLVTLDETTQNRLLTVIIKCNRADFLDVLFLKDDRSSPAELLTRRDPETQLSFLDQIICAANQPMIAMIEKHLGNEFILSHLLQSIELVKDNQAAGFLLVYDYKSWSPALQANEDRIVTILSQVIRFNNQQAIQQMAAAIPYDKLPRLFALALVDAFPQIQEVASKNLPTWQIPFLHPLVPALLVSVFAASFTLAIAHICCASSSWVLLPVPALAVVSAVGLAAGILACLSISESFDFYHAEEDITALTSLTPS